MKLSPKQAQQCVTDISKNLDVEVCSLYLADNTARTLQLVASTGLNKESVGAVLGFQQGLTGKVARTGKPVAARDPHTHPDYFYVEGSDEERFKSYLGIPLQHEQQLLGVLIIQTERTKMFMHSEIHALYGAGRELVESLIRAELVA